MKYQGIKKGKIIELLEDIDIPDGETVTVMLQRENQKELNFGESILKFREKHHLEENGIDATDEFLKNVRDQSIGGEVNW